MQVDNLFIVKEPLWPFLHKKVNIEVVNMLSVRLGCGHFNERLQHLHENLHIQLQSQDVVLKALAGLDCVACKVKDGPKKIWCKIVNEFFEKEHMPVDVNKSTTEDPILEQTSIKA